MKSQDSFVREYVILSFRSAQYGDIHVFSVNKC